MSYNCASCGEIVEKGHSIDECLENLEIKMKKIDDNIKRLTYEKLKMPFMELVDVVNADNVEELVEFFNKIPKDTVIITDCTLDMPFNCSYKIRFRYNSGIKTLIIEKVVQ